MNSLSGKQYINHDQKNQIICATKKNVVFVKKTFASFLKQLKLWKWRCGKRLNFHTKRCNGMESFFKERGDV